MDSMSYLLFHFIFIFFPSFSAVDNGAMQLSPIFFGILLTVLVLLSYCIVRILWKRTRQQKNDDVTDGSKQSSSLLCTGVGGNGNGNANNANHTDTITKVCIFFSFFFVSHKPKLPHSFSCTSVSTLCVFFFSLSFSFYLMMMMMTTM